MNQDLINRLAEQAQKYADDWGKGEIGWNDLFNSKFAELVAAHVREENKKLLKRFAYHIIEYTGHRRAVEWVAKGYGVDMESET